MAKFICNLYDKTEQVTICDGLMFSCREFCVPYEIVEPKTRNKRGSNKIAAIREWVNEQALNKDLTNQSYFSVAEFLHLFKNSQFSEDIVQMLEAVGIVWLKKTESVSEAVCLGIEKLSFTDASLQDKKRIWDLVFTEKAIHRIVLKHDNISDRNWRQLLSENWSRFVLSNNKVHCYAKRHYVYMKFVDCLIFFPSIVEFGTVKFEANYEDMIFNAVTRNGMYLQYVSDSLQNYKEVVLAAVTQNGLSYQYVSKEMQQDEKVILVAVRQNGMALQYIDRNLMDRKIVTEAVKQNGWMVLEKHSWIPEQESTEIKNIAFLSRYKDAEVVVDFIQDLLEAKYLAHKLDLANKKINVIVENPELEKSFGVFIKGTKLTILFEKEKKRETEQLSEMLDGCTSPTVEQPEEMFMGDTFLSVSKTLSKNSTSTIGFFAENDTEQYIVTAGHSFDVKVPNCESCKKLNAKECKTHEASCFVHEISNTEIAEKNMAQRGESVDAGYFPVDSEFFSICNKNRTGKHILQPIPSFTVEMAIQNCKELGKSVHVIAGVSGEIIEGTIVDVTYKNTIDEFRVSAPNGFMHGDSGSAAVVSLEQMLVEPLETGDNIDTYFCLLGILTEGAKESKKTGSKNGSNVDVFPDGFFQPASKITDLFNLRIIYNVGANTDHLPSVINQ